MLQAFLNIFRIPELRNKIFFTVGMLVIYKIGFFIPLPGINQGALKDWADPEGGSQLGDLIAFVGMFTGGSLSQSTVFGLGIMPYISAAIIMQLMGSVLPSLQALKKEGPSGYAKITEYTRYLTVALCVVQASFWLSLLQSQSDPMIVFPQYRSGGNAALFWLAGLTALTAGTVFLMWLGEQIDKYGIGNGASLIITAGIVGQLPWAIGRIAQGTAWTAGDADKPYGLDTIVLLACSFVAVVCGAVIITQGERRIPVQHAKYARGRRVYGGQKSYLPLRVNHGGVMPIIFASAMLVFPAMFFRWLAGITGGDPVTQFLADSFGIGGFLYVLVYIGMIYFFAYFWTTVQFQPSEMATQLRDHGSIIPGLRPGPRTAEYLETVMERITYVGASFLAVIAVIPTLVVAAFDVDWLVASFLGGTGLLICVSVMLDLVKRIEANLMMRNYQGFLGAGGSGRGPRIRGSRGMR
jgi:preprotein translocase subunit SecY